MAARTLLCFSLCLFLFPLLAEIGGVQGTSPQHHRRRYRPTKLFAFGDSYSDTGNTRKIGNAWKVPYGSTFPGKPSGRFSDGRVLTDFLAQYLRVRSPVPYRWRKYATNRLRCGMNFAYGGTGVFNTLVSYPNMTTQIDFFQNLIEEKFYTKQDLGASLALVTNAGNDYSAFLARGGTLTGLLDYITNMTDQLAANLKRLHGMGVREVAVAGLQPLGCLPGITADNSFTQCNDTLNLVVTFHNTALTNHVEQMNNETKDSPFVILNLYDAFTTILKNKRDQPGISKFENPLKPCCVGVTSDYYCSSVDENGKKLYNVCENPEGAFFWDLVHPTQAGWHAVYLALKSNLEQI